MSDTTTISLSEDGEVVHINGVRYYAPNTLNNFPEYHTKYFQVTMDYVDDKWHAELTAPDGHSIAVGGSIEEVLTLLNAGFTSTFDPAA